MGGDLEAEGAAFAPGARRGAGATEERREAPADGEAEAGPLLVPTGAAVDLGERPEEARHIFLFDADARVADGDDEPGVLDADPDRNAALLGELDGVGEQVEEDLLETPLVAGEARDLRCDVYLQAQRLGVGLGLN